MSWWPSAYPNGSLQPENASRRQTGMAGQATWEPLEALSTSGSPRPSVPHPAVIWACALSLPGPRSTANCTVQGPVARPKASCGAWAGSPVQLLTPLCSFCFHIYLHLLQFLFLSSSKPQTLPVICPQPLSSLLSQGLPGHRPVFQLQPGHKPRGPSSFTSRDPPRGALPPTLPSGCSLPTLPGPGEAPHLLPALNHCTFPEGPPRTQKPSALSEFPKRKFSYDIFNGFPVTLRTKFKP